VVTELYKSFTTVQKSSLFDLFCIPNLMPSVDCNVPISLTLIASDGLVYVKFDVKPEEHNADKIRKDIRVMQDHRFGWDLFPAIPF